MPSTTSDAEYAAQAVALHTDACLLLTRAYQEVRRLGAQRAEQKVAAVERLMKDKGWPVSRAENFAQLDAEYDAFKRQCDSADLARLTAALNVENAALAARYHLTRLGYQEAEEETRGKLETILAELKQAVDA